MKLWNTLGECKYTIQDGDAHSNWVSCVRFSPNNLQPTIVSSSWDQIVKIWNLTNCKIRASLAGHSGYVNTVAVLPDGSLCASGGKDGVILLWDLAEGKKLYSLDSGSIINALCISTDRYWLCATTEASIKIWDLESKTIVVDLKVDAKQEAKMNDAGAVVSSGVKNKCAQVQMDDRQSKTALEEGKLEDAVSCRAKAFNIHNHVLYFLWVQQQVIDVVTHIASTASKFPKKCVVLCLHDTGLQSSVAATRNATIKLIGALHKFVGPGASAAPKKTIKVLESTSALSGGGLDSPPREDISGKITPALLRGLESSDWKVRLESIEAINKILEEANKHIQPIGTVELFGALRGRLYDSNKNLIMATLSTIGAVASAIGLVVGKSSKVGRGQ
ncbi:hypothetical protein LOK49_LG11G01174 [Camellia lanceoleosa]|uniref:Uncharacterized protein n=1 Tax=Camellia lanceoleosa TaxID=1840588 RepID=A0ACC0FZA7_9ERIC|nr:hypothetical protein LOK49_LG11G01174 [Camellia lanceoleosa]